MTDGFTPARLEALRLVVESDVRQYRFSTRVILFEMRTRVVLFEMRPGSPNLRNQPYQWLLANGYIERKPPERDSRSIKIVATERGRHRLTQEPPR